MTELEISAAVYRYFYDLAYARLVPIFCDLAILIAKQGDICVSGERRPDQGMLASSLTLSRTGVCQPIWSTGVWKHDSMSF